MFSLLLLVCCGETEYPQQITPTQTKTIIETQSSASLAPQKRVPAGSRINETNIANFSFSLPPQEKAILQPIVLSPLHEASRNALLGMITQYGVLIDNPWALLHALLAIGPETKLPDGRDAIDALFSDYAEPSFSGKFIHFPQKKMKGTETILIEPHTDLALKVLTEIGVSPQRIFHVAGIERTFGDLYRSSLLETHLDPRSNISSFASPNDIPWSIQGLSTFATPKMEWESGSLVMNLEDLTAFLMAVVHQETRFLAQAYAAQTRFEKQKQGIFKYTCGGMHLIQALAYAHARGFGDEKTKAVLIEQVALLYFRFPIELSIYDDLMKAHPSYKVQLLIQRLKFVGHFLETTAKLEILGLTQTSLEMRSIQQGALDQLALITQALREENLIQNPQSASTKQLYLDLIGDAAHAVYGIDLIAGKRTIRF